MSNWAVLGIIILGVVVLRYMLLSLLWVIEQYKREKKKEEDQWIR